MAQLSDKKNDVPFGAVIASRIIEVDGSADKYVVGNRYPSSRLNDRLYAGTTEFTLARQATRRAGIH